MIDNLLYAKLTPKLKRSVNMARSENWSYEEIMAHLERELELNALEESDDLPIATMTSAQTKVAATSFHQALTRKPTALFAMEKDTAVKPALN